MLYADGLPFFCESGILVHAVPTSSAPSQKASGTESLLSFPDSISHNEPAQLIAGGIKLTPLNRTLGASLVLSLLPSPTAHFAFCPLAVINLSHEHGNKLSHMSTPSESSNLGFLETPNTHEFLS